MSLAQRLSSNGPRDYPGRTAHAEESPEAPGAPEAQSEPREEAERGPELNPVEW